MNRRDSSYALNRGGSLSYSLRREAAGQFEGMVITQHGIVHVSSVPPNQWESTGWRRFAMAFKGRIYHRVEEAPIASVRHGAVLAGKFARDVAQGRIA